MRLTDLINESITDIVYHASDIHNAVGIVDDGKLSLRPVSVNNHEIEFAKRKNQIYFLSTTRSKLGHYHSKERAFVVFQLDGKKLSHNYSASPVDYFHTDKNYKSRDKGDEMEDRLYSSNPEIPLWKYLVSVSIVADNNDPYYGAAIHHIVETLSKHKIPYKLFKDIKHYYNNKSDLTLNDYDNDTMYAPDKHVHKPDEQSEKILAAYVELLQGKEWETLSDTAREVYDNLHWYDIQRLIRKITTSSHSTKFNKSDIVHQYLMLAKKHNIKNQNDLIKIIQNNYSINESILNERLYEIDDDVQRIYERFFEEPLIMFRNLEFKSALKNLKELETQDLPLQSLVDDGTIKNQELISIIDTQPMTLTFRLSLGNVYRPIGKQINLTVNNIAIDVLLQYFDHNKHKSIHDFAVDLLPDEQYDQFISEFSGLKIKSSIHHELAHYMDDVQHNRHLEKKVRDYHDKNSPTLMGQPIGVGDNETYTEIQGIIHTIKQLYNHNKEKWDSISFSDMINMEPSLYAIVQDISPYRLPAYFRKLKSRMAREGLLGKNMR